MWRVEHEPFRHFPASEMVRLLRALERCGLSGPPICEALGIDPRAPARVPLDGVLAVLEHAEEVSGDPLVGLHAAAHTDLDDVTIALCATQPTFAASLAELHLFQALLFGTEALAVQHDPRGPRLVVSRGLDPWGLRQVTEYYARTLCREAVGLVGAMGQPVEICFAHAPAAEPAAYEDALGCRVVFYAPASALQFSAAAAGAPLASCNPAVAVELRRLARAQLERLPERSLVERVLQAIESAIRCAEPVECHHIARQLGMSVRTFQRRLDQELVTFRGLRDTVRERAALTAARRSGAHAPSIAALADALGYAEASSLCRAFKRWTGTSYRIYADGPE